jgi:hypothetical protein
MSHSKMLEDPGISAALAGRGDLWIFGYGSLMWDPGFHHAEARPALVHGYHRRFCVYSYSYRGTRARPGLVLGLDRGGACKGIAYRVPRRHAKASSMAASISSKSCARGSRAAPSRRFPAWSTARIRATRRSSRSTRRRA